MGKAEVTRGQASEENGKPVACSIEEHGRFFSIAARRVDGILRSLWFLLNFAALSNITCIINYLLTYLNPA
jgi:hypothetical protein